jgi:mycofactocin precursor peptide peptidase
VRSVSRNGVLGDPAGASAEEGRELLQAEVARLAGAIDAWRAP